MSISVESDRIVLSGHASVEDAEQLLAALIDHPGHAIDVTRLAQAHLAIVQLLYAAQRPLLGQPTDRFLCERALAGLIARDVS